MKTEESSSPLELLYQNFVAQDPPETPLSTSLPEDNLDTTIRCTPIPLKTTSHMAIDLAQLSISIPSGLSTNNQSMSTQTQTQTPAAAATTGTPKNPFRGSGEGGGGGSEGGSRGGGGGGGNTAGGSNANPGGTKYWEEN